MKIAVVGAYGNGKTTLTTELSAKLGLPRTHGSAMRDPAGGPGKSLDDCNEPELIRLAVRRLTERAVGEAGLPDGFLSDGSVLHEWIYTKVRLVLGRFPERPASLTGATRSPRTMVQEEVVDELGLLVREYARTGYDVFVHCPAEVPLPGRDRPISEHFRVLSDRLLLETLETLGRPVHVVTGPVGERVAQVLDLPVLRP